MNVLAHCLLVLNALLPAQKEEATAEKHPAAAAVVIVIERAATGSDSSGLLRGERLGSGLQALVTRGVTLAQLRMEEEVLDPRRRHALLTRAQRDTLEAHGFDWLHLRLSSTDPTPNLTALRAQRGSPPPPSSTEEKLRARFAEILELERASDGSAGGGVILGDPRAVAERIERAVARGVRWIVIEPPERSGAQETDTQAGGGAAIAPDALVAALARFAAAEKAPAFTLGLLTVEGEGKAMRASLAACGPQLREGWVFRHAAPLSVVVSTLLHTIGASPASSNAKEIWRDLLAK
jgi:hypothetical protein